MGERNPIIEPLTEWLLSCTRRGDISRNTIAVGIVVLNHLRLKCPVDPTDVITPGGEIMGARSALRDTLESYGLPREKFLKEATGRQAGPDGKRLFEALEFGKSIAEIDQSTRDQFLREAIQVLVEKGLEWLARENIKISCDRQLSPSAWVSSILAESKGRSGGKVEQHLVGAKLEQRHPDLEVPNHPGHAADVQTGRSGDFTIGSTCFHVTASPGSDVIRKCAANLGAGLHPFLLIPRDQLEKARHLAEDQHVDSRLTIVAIEDFIAVNIIELSNGDQPRFAELLKLIVEKYNRRLEEVETDMSLRIEIQ